MKKIAIVTLGCAKNTVDSEHLAGALERGYQVVFDNPTGFVDVLVINTCGFILDAKEESIAAILEAVRAKQAGQIGQLFVMGCLAERYANDLRAEIPEVDTFFGVNDLNKIIGLLGAPLQPTARKLTTPSHYAYLKISEGCNWRCGYCAIPLIRGGHVSVPIEELVQEATELAAKGVKELIVVAQDTTFYGKDLYGERRLGALLRKLCAIDGLEWVRLHYAYPAGFPDDVIEVLATEPKMCKYLDIPVQHISDSVLGSMRRATTKAETLELLHTLRERVPGIALRTTLLVGYPGETEADILELLDFVQAERFDRLGVFPYSEEEGTYSALELSDDVPQEEKESRADRVMAVQQQISLEANERKLGATLRVLVDRIEGDYYVGRTEFDSPEVDPEVWIKNTQVLEIGAFYSVLVERVEEFELYGSVVW